MSLKEILDKIAEAKATANIAPGDVEPRYRSGVEGRIRQAQRDLEELEKQYSDTVAASVVIVGLRGQRGEEFAKGAAERMVCVDALALTKKLAADINNRINYRGFGGQEMMLLMGSLNNMKRELGILTLPPINTQNSLPQGQVVPLAEAVDQVLNANYGKQLHTVAILKDAAIAALNAQHSAANLVVAVYNYDGIDRDLCKAPVVEVDFDRDLPADFDSNRLVDEVIEIIKTKLGKTLKKKSGKTANKEVI